MSSWVVYLVGLNGCEVPVLAYPPRSLAKGTNLLGGKPIYLKMDFPQSIMEGPKLKVPPPGGCSSSILIASPIRVPLQMVEGEVSMTMEVRELLSQAGLDMSGYISGNFTPKRLECVVLVTPPPTKPEDFPWPVDTSSQVSTLDDAEMGDTSLEEIPATSSPTAETPGPSSGAPPSDTAHLWEEANKALGELLVTKSSIDACWQKLVWQLSIALHQNNFRTVESIKEAKAICAHYTWEAETLYSTTISKAEAQGASQAGSLQQLHGKSIQHLEEQAIEEESKVSSTSSLPVKLPYKPALPNYVACW